MRPEEKDRGYGTMHFGVSSHTLNWLTWLNGLGDNLSRGIPGYRLTIMALLCSQAQSNSTHTSLVRNYWDYHELSFSKEFKFLPVDFLIPTGTICGD